MDIFISVFKALKEILDVIVAIITIKMFLESRNKRKHKKSKIKKRFRYKKIVPSKRKHH